MPRIASSRRRLILISGFLIAFLVVLNVSTFALYRRSKNFLDAELGERLRAMATTLARSVESNNADAFGVIADEALLTMLHTVKAENLLSNIVIVTPEGTTVADLGNLSAEGELNPFIQLDIGAVTLARSGLPSSTDLYRSGDIYMKSAYAPVFGSDADVIGIVGVEAGVTYFDVLRSLSNVIIAIDVAALAITAVLGFFFYRQSQRLHRVETAVIQGENLATMGRMVAGIAHEIRNPLTIIKASAERLQRKYGPDDEVFGYISEEVDNLDRILTGYLDFANVRSQGALPQALHPIVQRCVMLIRDGLDNKSIEVLESYPNHEMTVVVDDKRMQQAVLNVLINAVQAIDQRGTIEVSITGGARSATVSVKDDGRGIDRKHLREVTKPFFTTRQQGSGLGMSIVSNIVEEHHGRLQVHSEPGRGTQIDIELPLAAT